MAGKILCNCPLCGSLVDPAVITGDYDIRFTNKIMAGKSRRAAFLNGLPGQKTGRGSAPGRIEYQPVGDLTVNTYQPLIDIAIFHLVKKRQEAVK